MKKLFVASIMLVASLTSFAAFASRSCPYDEKFANCFIAQCQNNPVSRSLGLCSPCRMKDFASKNPGKVNFGCMTKRPHGESIEECLDAVRHFSSYC